MKHFSGKKLSYMKSEGRLCVKALSLFFIRENRIRSVLLEDVSSRANKALFYIPGCFVHVCRSNKNDSNTPIDVICWPTT